MNNFPKLKYDFIALKGRDNSVRRYAVTNGKRRLSSFSNNSK